MLGAGGVLAAGAPSGGDREAGSRPPRGPVTIRARHKSPGGDIWERMVGEYNARGGPIQIQFERAAGTGTEDHDKIAIEMAGGVAPDVFEMQFKRMPSFVNGRLLDLTKRFAAEQRLAEGRLLPRRLGPRVLGGEAYLLPQFDNPAALYYHAGLFQRRGAPAPGEGRRHLDVGQVPGDGAAPDQPRRGHLRLQPERVVGLPRALGLVERLRFRSKDRRRLIMRARRQQAVAFAVDLRLAPGHAGRRGAAGCREPAGHPLRRPAGHAAEHLQLVRDGAPARRRSLEHRPRAPRPGRLHPPLARHHVVEGASEAARPAFEVFEHFGSPEVHRQIPMLPRAAT